MNKKKLLVFHPALAPYRIDQFNALGKIFDLEVVFMLKNLWNFKYDQNQLLKQVNFKYSYLSIGPRYKSRVFRFGIFKKIKKTSPDIVFGYEYSFTTLYLILLKKLKVLKNPLGSIIDDNIQICEKVQSKARFHARNFAVKNLDFLVVVSQEIASFYQKTFSFSPKNIIISPFIQSIERLRANEKNLENIANSYVNNYHLSDKIILLFVGRFSPEKGLIPFIKDINKFLKKTPNIKLILVGDGAEKEELEKQIKQLGLESKTLLPGRFEGDNLHAWYLLASCLVLPSLSELFGAVVDEALIFGTKVFCSKYAGAKNLLNKNTGRIFDPLDHKNVSTELEKFIPDLMPLASVNPSDKPSLRTDDLSLITNEWEKIV